MSMVNCTRLVGTAFLAACMGLSGCATATKFASAYDTTVDFTKYSTYAFRADRKIDDPDRQRLAESIINQELGPKGFRLDAGSPDLTVGLAPFASADSQGGMLAAGTVTWSYQGPYDGLAVSSGGLGYKDAELSITFTDARTGSVVWHGIISGKLSYDDREGNYTRTIDAMRKVLHGFPPPRK
jgi:hypothetical protein